MQRLAAALTDPNFRIFAEAGELHLMNRHGHWHGPDVFRIFEQATSGDSDSGIYGKGHVPQPDGAIDRSHAFYLGYELARAEIALHLGKQYTQDEPMHWGLLGPTRALLRPHCTEIITKKCLNHFNESCAGIVSGRKCDVLQ